MHKLFMLALTGVALAVGPYAWAQEWPQRNVRIIVPFPAGGNVDVFGRVLYRQVEKELGRSVVIDNRGGANGIIGADVVAQATPDGYTMLNTSFAFAVNPAIRKELPFDVVKSFTPVTMVALGLGYVQVVNPKVPARTVQELIDLAKKEKLTYSTAGVGNGQHLTGALFNNAAGVEMLHVPYKGGGPAAAAVVGGETHVHYPAASVGIPHVKAGRLRAIAFTGAKRMQSMPDMPTIGETIPGFVADAGWHAVFAPAGTPAAVVNRMQQAIHAALQEPKVHAHFMNNGYEPSGMPAAQWAKQFREEVKRFAEIARMAKIEPK
jgi:tripartite-type tricarboxylate transporter receptor subunit TctC